ncbi:MAG TPA: flagellar biosynthetic protein FliQ [Vicinamibacterales bacterium]|jgi:flagellar biosynthetic protein FliQ|nr:flagellar biosynthetic protein FliQ [Vicinamibacterales bacterium]
MSEALVLGIVRQAIETAIIISLPMLAVGLVVGVLISILQTVTSIQDNILSFIPRAAAIFVVFAFTFPWMLRVVTGFAAALIRRLPDLVR